MIAYTVSKAELRSAWDAVADQWEKKIGDSGDLFRTELLNQALIDAIASHINTGARIMDAGCGNGYFGRMLWDRGYDISGVDFSPRQISYAKERLGDNVTCGDIEFLDGVTEDLDGIVCSMVLDGIDDVASALSGFRRRLRKCGALIVAIPHPAASFIFKNFTDSYVKGFMDSWLLQGVEKPVPYFHRSLSFYANAIIKSGFRLAGIDEIPDTQTFREYLKIRYMGRLPLDTSLVVFRAFK